MNITKYHTYLFWLFTTGLLVGCTGNSQTNNTIDYPALGISFEVPKKWETQEVENGLLVSHKEVSGFILLTTHDLKNKKAIQQEMEQGFTLGPNSKLTAMGALDTERDDMLGGSFTGTISGKPAQAYIVGMPNKYGQGLTLICGANVNAFSDRLKSAGLDLAKSVVFYDPNEKPLPIAKGNESAEWKAKFNNCRLTFMESYQSSGSSGYGKKIKIDLCAKGYFRHSSYSSMSVNGGAYSAGSGSNTKGSGTWTMIENQGQVVLRLHFYNKEVYEFTVTIDADDKTYLNGNRYFRTYEGAGKYSPACD